MEMDVGLSFVGFRLGLTAHNIPCGWVVGWLVGVSNCRPNIPVY